MRWYYYVYLGGDYAGMYEGPEENAIVSARQEIKGIEAFNPVPGKADLWSDQPGEAELVIPGVPTTRPISRKVLA